MGAGMNGKAGNDTAMRPLTALSLIDAHAERDPGKTAVIFEDRALSYGDLVGHSLRVASVLKRAGVGPGGGVCLFAVNCPEYYIVYLAVLRCGGTLFPINADLLDEEIGYIVSNSRPVLAITDEVGRERFVRSLDARGLDVPTLPLEGLMAEAAAQPPLHAAGAERSEDDIALVIHTSGTTARPKGVQASDRMEIQSALALGRQWEISADDRFVCALPLSYVFGLFTASYVALCHGASVLLFRKFHPVRVLEGIERHRATAIVGVPAMFGMMLEHLRDSGCDYDTASLRLVASSGAVIAPTIKDEFSRRIGQAILEYYALSECTPIFSFDVRDEHPMPAGSTGRLVPGAEVRILDDEGRPVGVDEVGRLQVRSERLMPGYFKDPQRTSDAFSDGWFNTGDLARLDGDGYFYIVGRLRDQVISGGHKISSAEIEDLLLKCNGVAAAAVVGAPHEILGEVVKAVVVPKPGAALTVEAVTAFCAARLAAYKVPRIVVFRESLPMSPAGKVLKKELVDLDAGA